MMDAPCEPAAARDGTIAPLMVPVPASRRIYSKPPIAEAIIDLRCGNPSILDLRDISRVAEALAGLGYSQTAESVEVVQIVAPDGSSQKTEKKVGVVLRSTDEKYLVQLQLEGFSCSRLQPYQRWEQFRDEAKRIWSVYRPAVQTETIRRISVRYVNRLDFGSPTVEDLDPFLRLRPVTPWGLSSPPAGFFLQVRQPFGDGSILIVNESTLQGVAAVILDLHAFLQREMTVNDETTWNVVEDLHVRVEDAFEASITDRVRELIR